MLGLRDPLQRTMAFSFIKGGDIVCTGGAGEAGFCGRLTPPTCFFSYLSLSLVAGWLTTMFILLMGLTSCNYSHSLVSCLSALAASSLLTHISVTHSSFEPGFPS